MGGAKHPSALLCEERRAPCFPTTQIPPTVVYCVLAQNKKAEDKRMLAGAEFLLMFYFIVTDEWVAKPQLFSSFDSSHFILLFS